MEILRHAREGFLELALEGRLDGYWAQHLSATLDDVIREGHHSVRVNLARASYISSAGIGVLVDMHKRLSAVDGSFAVTEPSRQVRHVLEMVGLAPMLLEGRKPAAAARTEATRTEADGIAFELYDETAGGSVVCYAVGHPDRLGSARFSSEDCRSISLAENRIALGLGAFGDDFDQCRDRFGEFLGVASAGAFQPTDGTNFPDYMLGSGSFVPRISALYGLSCEGSPSKLVRFESAVPNDPVPLSAVVKNCLALARTDSAAIVILAESAGLVGASLRRSPLADSIHASPFAYPEIRGWLSFSAERCHAHALVLIAGIASAAPPEQLRAFLRPIARETSINSHFHAAAFAYRPLQRGRLEMNAAARGLFETGGLQAVIHLLADTREFGAGESELRRGACWVAPIREFVQGEPPL